MLKKIKVIEEFLPKTRSKEELTKIIVGYIPLGNVGAVIKAVKEEVTSKGALFDGKTVSNIFNDLKVSQRG